MNNLYYVQDEKYNATMLKPKLTRKVLVMGKRKKVVIDGTSAKQIRERQKLTQENISDAADGKSDVKLSRSTLRRIENDDRSKEWPIEIANFIAGELNIPPALILPEEAFNSKHTIQLSRIETGEKFKEILDNSQGFSLDLDQEPDERRIREKYLETYSYLDNLYGSGVHYFINLKNENSILEKYIDTTKKEFELRNIIDDFSASGYSIFANHFYRYETYFSPDEDGPIWTGLKTKAEYGEMADWENDSDWEKDQPGYTHFWGLGTTYRAVLQLKVKKSDDLILDWKVDADPGQLAPDSQHQSNTLRQYMLEGGTSDMSHHAFISAVREECEQHRRHTEKSEKRDLTAKSEAAMK